MERVRSADYKGRAAREATGRRRWTSRCLEPPGQFHAVVSPVLFIGVLDMVLRAGVRVGGVEKIVHARRKIQPAGQVPAQEREIDDREPGGVVSGKRQTRAGVLRLDTGGERLATEGEVRVELRQVAGRVGEQVPRLLVAGLLKG